jgi:hypothetical protein
MRKQLSSDICVSAMAKIVGVMTILNSPKQSQTVMSRIRIEQPEARKFLVEIMEFIFFYLKKQKTKNLEYHIFARK